MKALTLNAPAKINLALKVGARREDGFHEIWSVMQAVSLADRITLEINEADDADSLEVTGELKDEIGSSDADNLASRAVAALRERFPGIPPLSITLEKQIPVGAGLGGGSSDAAAALKGVNRLCDLQLSPAGLAEIGAALGSDVPFFFTSGSAEVTGRGEKIRDVRLPLDYYVVLVTPPEKTSTAEAYRNLGRPRGLGPGAKTDLTSPHARNIFSDSGSTGHWLEALERLSNDFEDKLLEVNEMSGPDRGESPGRMAPTIKRIRDELRRVGAAVARLSGSGSTVFGIFLNPPVEDQLAHLRAQGWRAVTCRPVSLADWPAPGEPEVHRSEGWRRECELQRSGLPCVMRTN